MSGETENPSLMKTKKWDVYGGQNKGERDPPSAPYPHWQAQTKK